MVLVRGSGRRVPGELGRLNQEGAAVREEKGRQG